MPIVSGGGGGGTPYAPPTAREQAFGNNVSIANGATGILTWDHHSGSSLLDFTDPQVPTIVTAGIYALSLYVQPATALTVGGFFEVTLDMNLSGDDPSLATITSPSQTAAARTIQLALSQTWYLPVGGDIKVSVQNLDGAATRNFVLGNAALQRCT